MKLLVLTTVSALAVAGCTPTSTLVCPDTVYINKVDTPIDTCREENKPRFTLANIHRTKESKDDNEGNDSDDSGFSSVGTPDTDGSTDETRVKGNNGWGNGDQSAPGNSRENNNAENSNRSQRNHGQGKKN